MPAKIKTHARKIKKSHSYKPRGISEHAFRKVYWPYIPVVLIIGLLLTFNAQAGSISSFISSPSGRVLAYATSMSSSGLLSNTNSERASNGATALKINGKLAAAAQAKANDMASRNYWSHNTPEGKTPWTFVTAQGYKYQKLGENLAAGFSSEASTIDGWMASPPHKENLIDKAFTEVGFGWANNANYTSAGGGPMTIVVAFYGKPTVLATQTTKKSAVSPPPPASASTSPPPASRPTIRSAHEPEVVKPPKEDVAQESSTPPPNTESDTPSTKLAAPASRAEVAFASLPFATLATSVAVAGAVLALGIWASRHALAIRRAVIHGERFAIRHPLLDLGLLIITALFYLLTQTAGFIQ